MKELATTTTIEFNINKINPLWYLAMGIATMALTHMSFSIEIVAWVSSVPFLIYLGSAEKLRQNLSSK